MCYLPACLSAAVSPRPSSTSSFVAWMGLLLVAAAQLSFSLMNVTIELMHRSSTRQVTTLQVVAVRMFITYFGATSWMMVRKIQDPFFGPPPVRGLLFARGITGFFGLFGLYYSLGYMTLSDSTTLTFLTPALTGLFAHVFLGETFTQRELLSAFSSLVGVVFVARPAALFGGDDPASGERLSGWGIGARHIALGVSLLGVTNAAAAYTIISAIGRRAHAIHTVAYLSGACVIACILEMIIFRVPFVFPGTFRSFCYLIGSGLLGFLGQTLLSVGLQGEKAGRGSLVMYLQVIFSGVVDRLAFVHPHRLSFLSFLGSLIIVLSAVFGTFNHPLPPLPPLPHPFSPLAATQSLPMHSPKITRHNFQNHPILGDRRSSSSSASVSLAEKVKATLGGAFSTITGGGVGEKGGRRELSGPGERQGHGQGEGSGAWASGTMGGNEKTANGSVGGGGVGSGPSGRKSPRLVGGVSGGKVS